MKKRDLAARIDRLENAVFSRTSEGAGDDMGDTLAEIRDEIRAQNAVGLSQEPELVAPPPTQADGRMGSEVVTDVIKGRAIADELSQTQPTHPTPDADAIAWVCEQLRELERSLCPTPEQIRATRLAICDRLAGSADGGVAG